MLLVDVPVRCLRARPFLVYDVVLIGSPGRLDSYSPIRFTQLTPAPSTTVGTVRRFLSILPPSESNMIRIDFRSKHVHYINNLEVDAMHKRWRIYRDSDASLSRTNAVQFAIPRCICFGSCFHLWA